MISFLGLTDCDWSERSGRYFYRSCKCFGNINIYFDGIHDNMGVCVEMSGQGCRDFETFGTGDWDAIFLYFLSNQQEVNISRLDVAQDDFDCNLDLDAIIVDTFHGNYTSKLHHWNVQKGSRGATVEHGTRGGNMYIRIYDKKAERERSDLDYWARCELQMRDDCAVGFASSLFRAESRIDDLGNTYVEYLPDTPINKLYFQVLNNYLRYLEPSEDSNKSRWSTAEHWSRFLETVEKRSIFVSPGIEYNFDNLHHYIFSQAGNAIKLYIDLFGKSAFMRELDNIKRSKNRKYDVLRQLYKKSGEIA